MSNGSFSSQPQASATPGIGGFEVLLDAVAAKAPTPGGGAVACYVGALGAALSTMVVNYSTGKKNLVEHEPMLRGAVGRLQRAREVLLRLAEEDAQAYGLTNELSRLPETDPRRAGLAAAQLASAQVPLAAAAACCDLLRLLLELSTRTNRHLRSDLEIGAILAEAGIRTSACNVRINLPTLSEGHRSAMEASLKGLVEEGARLCEAVVGNCR